MFSLAHDEVHRAEHCVPREVDRIPQLRLVHAERARVLPAAIDALRSGHQARKVAPARLDQGMRERTGRLARARAGPGGNARRDLEVQQRAEQRGRIARIQVVVQGPEGVRGGHGHGHDRGRTRAGGGGGERGEVRAGGEEHELVRGMERAGLRRGALGGGGGDGEDVRGCGGVWGRERERGREAGARGGGGEVWLEGLAGGKHAVRGRPVSDWDAIGDKKRHVLVGLLAEAGADVLERDVGELGVGADEGVARDLGELGPGELARELDERRRGRRGRLERRRERAGREVVVGGARGDLEHRRLD